MGSGSARLTLRVLGRCHGGVTGEGDGGKLATGASGSADLSVQLAEAKKRVERLELILEASRNAIWVFDARTREVWWNENAYRLFGYDSSTTDLHRSWVARLHPEDRARVLAQFDESGAGTDTTFDGEYRLLFPDGRVALVEDHAYIERDAAGAVSAYVGVVTDITERRAAEEALRESEQRFRQITETIDDVFWLVDVPRTRILYVSPKYEQLWGRTMQSLYENIASFLESVHEDDRPRMRARLARELEYGYDDTFRIRKPDGSVAWIRDRAFPVRGPDGSVTAVAGLATDVTPQRRLEEQLAQSQKLESIGRLAGGVAHDFNNLLTVILSGAELALREAPQEGALRADLLQIREAGQRAANLTAQLLAFARRQVVAPVRVDLNELMRGMDRLLRRVIGEDIELVTLLAPDLGMVFVDRSRLEQVVVNLAVNARDAMPRGGRLTLQTSNFTVDAAFHPDIDTGEYVMLAVSDDGIGIAPDVLEHVFEPFFTTKDFGRGTGLGLATCYGMIRQAGGHILVESEPGSGTTFKILLPRESTGTVSVPPPAMSSPSGGHETILFVEDEAIVRTVGVRILRETGYTVIEAKGGADALRVASEHAGTIHLLLSDVVMPQMSGIDLARRLRETRPDLKVLLTSGYTEHTILEHGAPDMTSAFLQKPYVLESLLAKVRETLDAG